MTLAGIALAMSVGMADAKKKKPAPEADCSHVTYSADCGDTGLQLTGTKPDDPSAPLAVASKTEPGPLVPPEPIPEKNSTSSAASVNANANAPVDDIDTSEWYVGTMPDEPYDIPLVDRSKMDAKFERQDVVYEGKEPVGSIVVDIDRRFLYYITADHKAVRYSIGVGRQGFSWRGNAIVGRKGVWPHWTPTDTMRKILPNLPAGMDGGIDSPLGARAMYLYQDGHDIMFRIHGTNEPWSIGEQVSSGCVRLLNEDVADLYERVKIGTQVFVRNSKHGTGLKTAPDDISG
jgi:lipoprotein-anchoring transpeptidase ErfK/SrfK